jgi:hypothetical protein
MNGSYELPIEETLKTSWNKVSGSKGTIWIAFILCIVIAFVLGMIDQFLLTSAPKIEPLYNFVMSIVTTLLNLGLVYIGIRRAQDLPISYSFIFHTLHFRLGLKLIGLYILQGLICLIPVLLMVTGVILYQQHSVLISTLLFAIGMIAVLYLSFKLILAMGFVLDKEIGPIDAIKLSFRGTRSNFWRIVIIFILQSLFLILCTIPLGIGLIWGIPFAVINYGNIYKNLSTKNTMN